MGMRDLMMFFLLVIFVMVVIGFVVKVIHTLFKGGD